ncbi:dihydroorotate dehydrogenase electron transfer subunit [Clostridium sp. 'deep sea']|uniref:dihydroorotate dehydrogenase electron transfer subunit n=1 Tax=Clostridium sp. 'deep sea' TaxID=2779445 RepID=UPI001896471C|nr:dihydroorotate dehydrogenase electron transfer subunit [Clostridium sp. 'deep sea']QOR35678.1 dihydroorotate dehydrogenase electron transfer subunit [Clostridium sp. 'deep sea']
MTKKIYKLPIISNTKICDDIYLITLKSKELSLVLEPGQFLHVQCGESNFQILRRPISIFDCDKNNEAIKMLYKVVGKGTTSLTQYKQGNTLDVIAPLGNSFDLSCKNPLIVGGGIGVAPLKYLIRELNVKGIKPTVVLGYSNADQAKMSELFTDVDCRLFNCTIDGTAGFKGNCCEYAKQLLKDYSFDVIYACGPNIMLANLPKSSCRTFVSLEAYMACGVGACLGCAVKKTEGGYFHVCKDGPVFNIKEVNINEQ